ncbi:ATP-binding domain-containing protein [Thalassospira sp. MCCC 1A01428]|uniref:ATP-binding domain-containing protein n=1 Tax=Thalassospira sp. MCCC 1A01428 TaxID=1470575 RepID=UPI000A1F55AA|nr:ATP-binding domain-containing protein [Thalassospira sp. MCCC 1A01428]
MNKTDREAIIEDIARNSLDCIEKVAADAESARASHKRSNVTAFTTINTLNSPQLAKNIEAVSDVEADAIAVLIQQPVIARVHFLDENDKEDVIFITRSTPRSVPGYKIASYRTELGKIASLAAGDEGSFRFGSKERDLLIESRALLKPTRDEKGWDSRDTEIDIRDLGKFTVGSLCDLLEPKEKIEEGDLDALWEDDSEKNVVEGVRRAIITHMELRDQPILDRHQDEIFRMPINTKCFLSGPPGTGKTTTLIRRLGQKTDRQALQETPDELRLVEQVESETGRPHETNWIVFSPTELLRQYVKDAFAREGLAASNTQIRTWDDFRWEIARDDLKLLRTSSGSAPFVERRTQSYLAAETGDDAAWFDDFRSYLDASFFEEVKVDANWLAGRMTDDLRTIGLLLSDALDSPRNGMYAHAVSVVAELIPDIREAVSARNDAVSRLLVKARNALVYEDRNFPNVLRDEISRQLSDSVQVSEGEEEFELALDDEDQIEAEPQPGRPVSRRQALVRLERALKTLAKSRLTRRSVSEKSQDGMLLAWLGEQRIPSDDDLKSMGELLTEQARLRKFERLERLFLRGIAPKYKRYRGDRAKVSRWYSSTPSKPSDIFWRELDLVVLASLQIANELLDYHRRQAGNDLPASGLLGSLRNLHRAQVLVDEATDFSRIQLACMHEISHPISGSFFLCGDINQRLTSWGLKSNEALDWITSGILRKSITVSYRQSQRLVDLAKDVASLGGSIAEDIILPDRLDVEGVAPVWKEGLGDNAEVSDWLTSRIFEIDRMLGQSTTIAVLVNDEANVEPLAVTLNDRLEEISLAAVACKDGKVVGNDRDVRVFDIRHIKGLEFEAVFFVGLDETIAKHSELFAKFLYVGATRAATYLGVTFSGAIPDVVAPLATHFQGKW